MTKNNFLNSVFFFGLFLPVWTISQVGFQNKKNAFGLDFIANTPVFSGAFKDTIYKEKSGKMQPSKEILNYGFSAIYVRQLINGVGLGLEVNSKQFLVPTPRYYLYIHGNNVLHKYVDTIYLRMQNIEIWTNSLNFRIEFSDKKGIGPAGIIHALGFGMTNTFIKNKIYKYALNEFGRDEKNEQNWSETDNYFVHKSYPSLKGVSASYEMVYRSPISKHLSIDLGVKSKINVLFEKSNEELEFPDGHPIDFAKVYHFAKRENLLSINIKIGLSYLF